MRRSAILALLLVIVVNTMAAACVSDTRGLRASRCPRKAHTAQVSGNRAPHASSAWVGGSAMRDTGCARTLHRAPEQCRMRGFAHTPAAALARAERLEAQPVATANILPPDTPRVISSSVGPPETDRGPPRA
jgi:hypothetical protein